MKVRALTEIPTAKGIISAGQIIEIPESVMLNLQGKVAEITPAVDCKPSTKTSPTSKADLTTAVIVDPVAPAKARWTPDVQSMVDWFTTLEPQAITPFYLEPHIHVADPVKFFLSLRREIETGPRGPRARLGTLQSDLRKLKKFLH